MLTGKVAVVTGGSRGIGRSIALDLAKEGAKVVIFYAGNHGAAEETVSAITDLGAEAAAFQVDVADSGQVDDAFKQVVKQFGRVDILVNNAGITRDNLLMRIKEEDWDQVVDTNLKGVFLCCKAVVRPMMKQRGGRIINISSVVGVSGNAGQANYVAAKAGVIGLTKTMAKEFGSRNITVNAIAPGFIQTDMTSVLDEKVKEATLASIPLGRFGVAEEVANAVSFLASDKASYITGQTLHVDGGMVPN
ncbi:3-oxoacyl-[acyl-carrier-protein] reductase [Shimazuella sp. AN120528]|uniref:3-oxoacyl-[acyl-carrier-protein] reductase n=1 Tax=Shimazuella soli TaxID=1892854 RepID=UPI001F10BDF1|nr:3-oxoacyl-[acyl-carrier-protein] reductase [Shimazuella soli]MCH5584964.1 3-oxoacyl-[acyl-carrier-protein] reductase [Shimazuella soli]